MITWIERKKGSTAKSEEVVLSIGKSRSDKAGNKRYCVAITFYNDSDKKATNSEYVRLGIDNDNKKIYFKSGSRDADYKVSATKAETSKRVQFTVSDKSMWEIFVGRYSLLFDRNEGLYYIDYYKKN